MAVQHGRHGPGGTAAMSGAEGATVPGTARPSLDIHVRDDAGLGDAFERDGVVLVRELLSTDEVAELRYNITRYEKWMLPHVPEDWQRREADGSIRGMYFLERVDPWFERFAARPDLPRIVEQITGRKARFASMETFHKQPRVGSPSLVHQDGVYYVGTPIVGVNVWIAVDDATESNAALKYWLGTQRLGLLAHGESPGDPFFRKMDPELVRSLGEPAIAELPSGWGAFHSDLIVHGSDANVSSRQRLAIAMTYTLDADQQ